MKYNLFIDDQIDDWDEDSKRFIRDPKFIDPSREYTAVKSVDEAKEYILAHGCPAFISFDFDLGKNSEGNIIQSSELAQWLVEKDMDEDKKFIPEDFSYQVHSKNVTAVANLSILENWLKRRNSW